MYSYIYIYYYFIIIMLNELCLYIFTCKNTSIYTSFIVKLVLYKSLIIYCPNKKCQLKEKPRTARIIMMMDV